MKIREDAAIRGDLAILCAGLPANSNNWRGIGGYHNRGNVGNPPSVSGTNNDTGRGAGHGDGHGAGRGRGRGAGRGDGDRGNYDDMSCKERSRSTGSFYARPNVTNFLPAGLSMEYYADWMYIGRYCSKPFGTFSGISSLITSVIALISK